MDEKTQLWSEFRWHSLRKQTKRQIAGNEAVASTCSILRRGTILCYGFQNNKLKNVATRKLPTSNIIVFFCDWQVVGFENLCSKDRSSALVLDSDAYVSPHSSMFRFGCMAAIWVVLGNRSWFTHEYSNLSFISRYSPSCSDGQHLNNMKPCR